MAPPGIKDRLSKANPRIYIITAVVFLCLATVTWLYQERQALLAEQAELSSSLNDLGSAKADADILRLGFSADGVNGEETNSKSDDSDSEASAAGEEGVSKGALEEQGFEGGEKGSGEEAAADSSGGDRVGEGASEGTGKKEEACEDKSPECEDWARVGECENNKDWMVGTDEEEGNCRLSCGICKNSALLASFGARESQIDEETGMTERGSMPREDANDLAADEETTKEQLSDVDTVESATSAGAEVGGPRLGFETGEEEGRDEEGRLESVECTDKSTNCEEWARGGECERNKEYMVGGDGYEGQCALSCGACPGAKDTKVEQNIDIVAKRVADHDLKWPEKTLESGVVCIGISTTACVRGLWSPGVERLKATDRSVAGGVGGPTGCKQAWATVMTSDAQLPGVLTLFYTIRKYTSVDRDMVVFITAGVSQSAVEGLQKACVVLKRITEPFDPSTHIGFVKLNLWLAVEYAKIVVVEHNMWFRKDPEMLFDYSAPAAVQAPPHPRVLNDVYNADAMVLEPSRQTFFDMLSKVGTLDSAERIGNHTVNSVKLFLSGYFDQWTTIPQSYVESVLQTVNKLVPELQNTRIRHVITSMPPYTKDTQLDYSILDAGGVQMDNEKVQPWQPSWRIPCAWECRYRKYHHLHEAVLEEWWHYYYDMVDLPLPQDRSTYWLLEAHDPNRLFDKKEFEFCLPVNCEVPEDFVADLNKYKEGILSKHTPVKMGKPAPVKRKKKGRKLALR